MPVKSKSGKALKLEDPGRYTMGNTTVTVMSPTAGKVAPKKEKKKKKKSMEEITRMYRQDMMRADRNIAKSKASR